MDRQFHPQITWMIDPSGMAMEITCKDHSYIYMHCTVHRMGLSHSFSIIHLPESKHTALLSRYILYFYDADMRLLQAAHSDADVFQCYKYVLPFRRSRVIISRFSKGGSGIKKIF